MLGCCTRTGSVILLAAGVWASVLAKGFDHDCVTYAEVLRQHVRPPRVDYRSLKVHRTLLDRVVAEFASPDAAGEPRWTREQRMAFWINAYNTFTLRVIVDHYPI
jgi:hypothetical protein